MKKVVGVLLVILGVACSKNEDKAEAYLSQEEKIESCIAHKIEEVLAGDPQNPRTEIWLWKSSAELYYYVNAPCCDQFSVLFNEDCAVVCAPDGGFSGNGDGACPEFAADLSRILVWKDIRIK
ncbi:MAG: hypothetical protein ACJAY8_001063 [Sphingobacteriales bacterium]|jgi:hypothetical protein